MLSSKLCVWLLLFLLGSPFLKAQGTGGGLDDPASLVGLSLDELAGRFGMPKQVRSARGLEEWQDDVVFVYDAGDFYIYKDRVWQLGLKRALGIREGDPASVVSLILGDGVSLRKGGNGLDSVYYPMNDKSWPMMLRCDLDKLGRVAVIFIYRTDV